MVRKAAEYLVRNGPVTPEDRWEVDPGYSPFTLAAEIAALLAAADIAETQRQNGIAAYLRDTADNWNDNIERWIYMTGSEPASKVGVDGHYVRIGAIRTAGAPFPRGRFVSSKKQDNTGLIVGPDALALIRFGLRAADDPRMVNTVRVIDHYLKCQTKCGPAWRRYPQDAYGEYSDGSPYDGSGVGRSWPLLTGNGEFRE
jgi:glucoamylase